MQIRVIQTAKNTEDRLTEIGFLSEKEVNEGPKMWLDPTQQFQELIGFGGAFTEAAAVTLSHATPQQYEEIIQSYYHPTKGLGYTLGRVHIHSCDFSLGNYIYIEEGDDALSTFSVAHDEAFIIPLIQAAIKESDHNIKFLASPWSPPAWMKSNGEMNHGGYLLDAYKETWAMYYTKFIKAYSAYGINTWAITIQNEPAAVQTWDSCIYSGEDERDFLKNYLGPIMKREGHGDVKILIWDHNRDIMVERAQAVLEDPEAAQYVWGTGFHWYVSEAFENVGKVHELYPHKHLLFTEGCDEGGVKLGSWLTGERYGRNIIGDLNNFCEGYLDWNIVLDERGGPNHVGNYCDAPIIFDTTKKEIHYNSSYFYIGHFSKFIKPGAKRMHCEMKEEQVYATAFQNPNGEMVCVVMNERNEGFKINFLIESRTYEVELPEHSIQTLIITS